ncbi:MAG: tRNA (N6-isopentenyl adenosine(37)-C2)-methylthiotransferase MiaB [Chloroflexi bacterium]|nr:tRNA (N6-isopentenyl adenosine(37)-C2)-methylthiotransferase MiaB [Chloroflexota bacterium]
MATFHVWTVGCQMNKADSERLTAGFEQMGLSSIDDPAEADVVILNTCVVRQSAEDTATGMLGKLKRVKRRHPERIIGVMGCMVGPAKTDLERRFPQVDVWAQPQQFEPILATVGTALGMDYEGCLESMIPAAPSIATFVPIIHGCDKFCTFCIIPYRRGREVSRSVSEVVEEVVLLVRRGVKEITFLGQNVDSYGHDFSPQQDLADLLYSAHQVDGLERIRFLTSHPSDMSSRIIQAIADLPKVCELVNLPFQAGDDDVLERMRRGYTRAEYLEKIAEIRETVPGVALTTDLIVGFSGESEDQFQRSLDVLEAVKFDKVHSAAYSVRPGTIASRQHPDDVTAVEKKRRLKAVEALQDRVQTEINAVYQGREYEILVDGHTRGRVTGRTRTDKLVFVEGAESESGRFVNVKIEGTTPYSLTGRVVESELAEAVTV